MIYRGVKAKHTRMLQTERIKPVQERVFHYYFLKNTSLTNDTPVFGDLNTLIGDPSEAPSTFQKSRQQTIFAKDTELIQFL